MPPAKMRGDGRKAKDPKKTLLRLLSYLKKYTPILIIVMLCVFATAFAQITGSTALGDLVDEFILPMVSNGSEDFSALTSFIFKIAAIGIVVAILNQVLIRSGREDQALMTTLAGLIVVLFMLIDQISALFDKIQSMLGL